ncbi:MAG: NUDIX domain-containing protein [Thermomicrobiales bacterium]|nr:NUDIX domain-containing protein [Thermomicrobiales bacterium]
MTNTPGLAQDPAEPFDVLRADGTATGRVKARAAVHRDGDWHRALHVWIAGRDGAGEPFLMFQRRSADKDSWPNHYDTTVGGHFRAGETLTETLREMEEEIGLPAADLALRYLGTRRSVSEQPTLVDRELQDVYLVVDDRPLSAYRPHPLELSALARFPLRDLLPFFAGEVADVHGDAVTPEDATPTPVRATLAEFIPRLDRYNLRMAIAASNVLRGDRYVAV